MVCTLTRKLVFDTTGSETSSMYGYDMSLPGSPSSSYTSASGSLPISLDELGLNDREGFSLGAAGPSRHRSASLSDQSTFSFSHRPDEGTRHQRSASVSARFDYPSWNLNQPRFSPGLMLNVAGSAALSHESPNMPTDEQLFPPLTYNDSEMASYAMQPRYGDVGSPHPSHSRSVSWDSPGVRPPSGQMFDPSLENNFLTVPSSQTLSRRNAHRRTASHNEEGSSPGRPRLMVPGRHHSPARSSSGGSPRIQMHHLSTNSFSSDTFDYSSTSPQGLEFDFSMFQDGYGSLSPASPLSSAISHLSVGSDGYASDTSTSPSSYSPLLQHAPPSPSMPGFNINIIPPDDQGIGRRNSYTANTIDHEINENNRLHRALSDPSPSRPASRGRGRRNAGTVVEGTSVFRSSMHGSTLGPDALETSTSSGTMQQFSSSPSNAGSRSSSTEPQFKKTVATAKIVQAAKKRRRIKDKVGAHVCPHCSQDFTTRHNLNCEFAFLLPVWPHTEGLGVDHVQSHVGKKQHECPWCGQKSVFPHVIKRHMDKSCKSRPETNTEPSAGSLQDGPPPSQAGSSSQSTPQ